MDQPECYRGQRPDYEQDYLSVSQAGGSQQGQYQSTVSPVNIPSQQDRLNTIPSQQLFINWAYTYLQCNFHVKEILKRDFDFLLYA